MSKTLTSKPWLVTLAAVVIAAILAAAVHFGLITMDGAAVTGATAIVLAALRSILALTTKAGWGKKTIPSAVVLLALSIMQAHGIAVPEWIMQFLSGLGILGIGDSVGLLKKTPS